MTIRPVPLYRKKAFWIVVIPLLIVLCAGVVWYVYVRPAQVHVTLQDGRIQVKPAELKGIQGSVRFFVENQGAEPHQFILLYINKPPGQIPVKDGVAQFFSEANDKEDISSWTMVIYDGFQDGGYGMPGPQANPPLGPPMQSGEKKVVNYGIPTMKIGSQTLTILCNLPGHYERGEYAALSINK
jgi:uncharacterized cupredoxin-like copper-binding protein